MFSFYFFPLLLLATIQTKQIDYLGLLSQGVGFSYDLRALARDEGFIVQGL